MTTGSEPQPSDAELAEAEADVAATVRTFGDALDALIDKHGPKGVSFSGNWMIAYGANGYPADVASGFYPSAQEAIDDICQHAAMVTLQAPGGEHVCPHCTIRSLLFAALYVSDRIGEGDLTRGPELLSGAKELIASIIKAAGGPEAFGDELVRSPSADTRH